MVPPATMSAAVGWRIWLSFPPSSRSPAVMPPKLTAIPATVPLSTMGLYFGMDGSAVGSPGPRIGAERGDSRWRSLRR